jgi:uncharacterized protein YjiS (DUF1127 family)
VRVTNRIARRSALDSTGPATHRGKSGVRAPTLLDLTRKIWRYLRLRPRRRKRKLESLPNHLFADVGLNGPGYERPTWDDYIHRQ